MSADLVALDAESARALTDRIKVAVEGTWELIKQAYTSRAWSALGYSSWDDYCTREFGTSRLRLPREERSEVVASLRESGLSIRAIEAATGLGKSTVQRELAPVPNGTPDPDLHGQSDLAAMVNPTSTEVNLTAVADDPFGPDLPSGEYSDLASIVDDLEDDDEPALTQEECEALDEANMTDAELARQAERMEAESRVTGMDGKSYPATAPRKPNRKPITDSFWTATYDLEKKVTTLTNLAADDRFKSNADQIRDRNLNDLIRARDALQGVIDQLTQGA